MHGSGVSRFEEQATSYFVTLFWNGRFVNWLHKWMRMSDCVHVEFVAKWRGKKKKELMAASKITYRPDNDFVCVLCMAKRKHRK